MKLTDFLVGDSVNGEIFDCTGRMPVVHVARDPYVMAAGLISLYLLGVSTS